MGAPTSPDCQLPGADYPSSYADINRLYDNVQVQIPGVTTDMVSLLTWNTIEEFYLRSTYRRENVYWEMPAGQLTINFDPWPDGWRVCGFLGFRGLSNPKFVSPGLLQDLTYPPSPAVRKGQILLALKPPNIDATLRYDVWTQWFETLLAGVLFRLYLQPSKPYSDPQMARLQGSFFRAGIASARALVQAGNITDGVASWRFPYFSHGHSKGPY